MSGTTAQLGKVLIIGGILLVGLGMVLMLSSRIPFLGLGRLPGDIAFKGKDMSFYFPIVTCLLISAMLTLVLWLFSYLSRR